LVLLLLLLLLGIISLALDLCAPEAIVIHSTGFP